jgi:ankyrin repeat protein
MAIAILLTIFLIIFNFSILNAQEKFQIIENEESAKKINKQEKTIRKLNKKNTEEKNSDEDSSTNKTASSIISPTPNIYDYSQDDVAGINVLMMAVNSNDIQGVSFFSKAGGILVNQKNIGGATALHIACREGFYEIAKILIENGADVNSVDNEGWTPLMRANINGHHELVALLVAKGVQSGGLNYTGESAIMHATLANCDKCLNIMFEKVNFLQSLTLKALKEQITDSFIISRNKENPKIQGLLEAFLDRIIKVSPSVSNEEFKKKMTADNSNISKSSESA